MPEPASLLLLATGLAVAAAQAAVLAELSRISGIGPAKLEKHGPDVLAVLSGGAAG